ncbi:MAG: fumarylacetoacetate hydrolase family protein [Rhodocyclaceae bacterium]|nr:fumarylacetoacetate hydrolase family protein [Rhodocyclaceae bacterium]
MSDPRQAAALLWQHRRAGTTLDALPPGLRPADKAQGHAIQAQLPVVTGHRLAGWKIAATSAAGQQHINVKGPMAGRILDSFVRAQGEPVSLAGNRMRVVEPEFAFRIGTDLPPRAAPRSTGEVLAAVASLHPAFEVPDSRYTVFTEVGEAQLIADDACCGVFLFGPAAPGDWRTLDLASHRVRASVVGSDGQPRYARDGEGRAALGDPRVALTWLVNELSSLDVTLTAGQTISTGTCMVPLEIQPGDSVHADYGVLGRIEIVLRA